MFAKHFWIAFVVAIGFSHAALAQEKPSNDEQSNTKSKAQGLFDVQFADQGNLRLALEVDRLDFETPYGKLQIPVSEIQQIDLSLRLTDSELKRLDAAIFNLGSADFGQRDEASSVLMELGAKAYPAVVKAARHADLEVAQRAQDMAVKLRDSLSEEDLAPREFDVIETEHSRFSGRIVSKQLAVRTTQFGKQQLELSNVRSMVSTSGGRKPVELVDVQHDPGNLLSFHGSIGKTLAFKVTGRADGIVFGTGIYTTDSHLATAAVHSGVLKPGETGVVRVNMLPSPPAFASTAQHGVSSHAWGPYPAAYQVVVPKRRK